MSEGETFKPEMTEESVAPETGIEQSAETQNLFSQMKEKSPNRNAVFTAIENLSSEAEIQQFFHDYVDHLEKEAIENPDNLATENISYILGYQKKEDQKRWRQALPELVSTLAVMQQSHEKIWKEKG